MEATLPKPDWLRVRANTRPEFAEVRGTLKELRVRTVCDHSHCPNIGDCWSRRCATFLILGDVCTRGCRFCAVRSGAEGSPVDAEEPGRVAEAVARFGLRHVVITSVTRDDLPDGGSGAYASVVRAVRNRAPACKVELLVPDLGGSREELKTVLSSGPDVLGHNVETVERLTPSVRDAKASYRASLKVLALSKEISPDVLTKSSIMLGLGEGLDEVLRTMDDLIEADVDILTIGQYLRPGREQVPMSRYVAPDEFEELRRAAEAKGFGHVSAGPFVRSSYRAKEAYESIRRNE